MSLTGDLMRAGFPRREALALATALGNGGGGGGGGGEVVFSARTDVGYVTNALATGATQAGIVTLALSYRLYRLGVSGAARVRLYATAAQRDADADRAVGTDPSGDHGVMLEYVATQVGLFGLSPMVDGASLEVVPSTSIPISVTNLGSAGPVTVAFVYSRTE